MQIQAVQTTIPNFGAKLKVNEHSENFVNTMNPKELKEFKSALKSLDKHNKEDVLEIKKATICENEFESPSTRYFLVNKNNNDAETKVDAEFSEEEGLFVTTAKTLIRSIREAAEKGSEMYHALFDRASEEN